jgi:hypothetical protein
MHKDLDLIDVLDIFLFSTVTNSNIKTYPTLNVYPHKVIKACIIYLEKLKRNYQGLVNIILNGKR